MFIYQIYMSLSESHCWAIHETSWKIYNSSRPGANGVAIKKYNDDNNNTSSSSK